MSWLNTPELIIEDEHTYDEVQSYYWVGVDVEFHERKREITVTRERWVGSDYTAAAAKKSALKSDPAYSDVHVVAAGGGQYHVVAVKTVQAEWSAWTVESYSEEGGA